MADNRLFHGDNLDVLREEIEDESVDLVYLDPPFNSNQDYNVLFAEQDGSRAAAQIKAFGDTWRWDEGSVLAWQQVVESGGRVADALLALRKFLGGSNVLAYLSMMAPRLVELRRVLRPTGSIYLHCDPTASHYLKMLMDAVFGPNNFLNEIVWHYRKWPAGKYTFQRNHDVIFFYRRSAERTRVFNQLYMERTESTLKRFGKAKIVSGHDEAGRRRPSQMDEDESAGVRMDDVWNIPRVPPIKQLFPTQKPERLLERIITASSNESDVVLDPFCGCGTAIIVAEALQRRWIGIDITHLAINLIRHRLAKALGTPTAPYKVKGLPVSLPDAAALAAGDHYGFQWWALGQVGARAAEQKKGADQGIDGRLLFHDEPIGGKTKQVILSVKAGHVGVQHVRDLLGVMAREGAEIGCLISLQAPTSAMRKEAASAGYYTSRWGTNHARMQLLTVAEMFAGKGVDLPASEQTSVTLKRPPKIKLGSDLAEPELPF